MDEEKNTTVAETEEKYKNKIEIMSEKNKISNGEEESVSEHSSVDVLKTDAVDLKAERMSPEPMEKKDAASVEEGDTTPMEEGDTGPVKEDVTAPAKVVDISTDTPTDEYHYLKTGEYTSEMFKVSVKNIPHGVPFGRFRTQIRSWLGFNPRKIKYNPRNDYAFLALANTEEQSKAVELLNLRDWKTNKLICKLAAPMKDPLVAQRQQRKRQQTEEEGEEGGGGRKRGRREEVEEEDDSLPPEERIVKVVCPYAGKPYEEQLKLKENQMRRCMERMTSNMRHQKVGVEWLPPRNDTEKLCLELHPIIRSPVLDNYRNKVEFTIGSGSDGVGNTVGFRLGSYVKGNLSIIGPSKCPNCTLESIEIAREFQTFIRGLPYPSYNSSTHKGFWQQCIVRTTTTGDVMVIIQAKTSFLTEEQLSDVKEKMNDFFSKPVGSVNVSSFYLSTSTQGNSSIDSFQHMGGSEQIEEELLGLKFRISPDAFFQVNSSAAEVLYRTIGEWCGAQDDACVLDVCCGTGTIGLCLAQSSSTLQIIGIEISEQAVSDARHNATRNNVGNATFVCGPAEDVIHKTVKKIKTNNIIAVVDPPRAGLRRNVIDTLRSCAAIKKIIYVSCSPNQAADNIVSFCRPQSKRMPGVPFRTVRAVPVDLFPHTPHCELVVELQRCDDGGAKVEEGGDVVQNEVQTGVQNEVQTEVQNGGETITQNEVHDGAQDVIMSGVQNDEVENGNVVPEVGSERGQSEGGG